MSRDPSRGLRIPSATSPKALNTAWMRTILNVRSSQVTVIVIEPPSAPGTTSVPTPMGTGPRVRGSVVDRRADASKLVRTDGRRAVAEAAVPVATVEKAPDIDVTTIAEPNWPPSVVDPRAAGVVLPEYWGMTSPPPTPPPPPHPAAYMTTTAKPPA